jgi:hypothetical protein
MLKNIAIILGGALVAIVAFALTLSIMDRGFSTTFFQILKFINP